MGKYSHLSDAELRQRIHKLEAEGQTGRTHSGLHQLNCEQTDRLSADEIRQLIKKRNAQGKPVGKLLTAARRRGLRLY